MSSRGHEQFYRIAVLDMQPIDPPVGGGRLRLFGLYHNLGKNLYVNYVGSYDWPGASSRKHRLSISLLETDIPLSDAHFEVNNKWSRFVHGRTIIDSVFGMMGHLSVEYMKAVRNALAESDVVVFSHPWVYPLVRTLIEDLKPVVLYDAHNFEGLLRMELLDDGRVGTEISKHVIITEFELAHRAEGVLACSKEDCRLFKSIYGIDDSKLHLVPNGVYSSMIIPPSPTQKSEAKAELGLKGEVAIFIGSMYKPNVEATKVICASLAPALPNVNFVICGGVSEAQELLRFKSQNPHNVHFVGPVTEQKKKKYLWAADLAINPMSSGSGTNIKMFDFMTAGLPVVSTPVGARGIEAEEGIRSFLVCDLADFAAGIESVIKDDTLRAELSQGGRLLVKNRYSWEDISPRLGSLITEMMLGRTKGKANASFSPEYPSITLPLVKIDHRTTLAAGTNVSKTLGLITPWGIRCGISEYSRYLSRGLAEQNIACRVFASKNEQLEQVNENCNNVFIDCSWRYGDINVDRIIQGCKTKEIGNINIQYHPNFFSEPTLVNIAQRCAENEINLSVTLHNTLDMNLQSLLVLSKMPVKLLVHSQKELTRLAALGVENLHLIPFGTLDVAEQSVEAAKKEVGIINSPVIGTFGFLRPHKGLLELIEAISVLKDLFPNILLFGLCALYPAEDSKDYEQRCKERILDLQLNNHVLLDTRFAEIEYVINKLHACDVVVLPYHPSNEGASASAHTVISSRRPLITTRQQIFREVSGVSYQVENNAPEALAVGIANVLTSPLLMKSLKAQIERYIKSSSWAAVARKYQELLSLN